MQKKNRALAPHLKIYKPQISSVISIFHRISGSILAFSCICFLFLLCLNLSFSEFSLYYNEILIIQVYFYWLFSSLSRFLFIFICFHFCNGIRHLIWDLTIGLNSKNVSTTGLLVLTITAIIFFFILI